MADTLTEYSTVPLLLERTPRRHNILIGNEPAHIRFAEQFLSTAHAVPIKHEPVPAVNDEMLDGKSEPKLYLVERSGLIDISPKIRDKTGIWSLDFIERGSAGINAIIRYAAKLLGIEKPTKEVMSQVGYELVKDSDPGSKKYLLIDIRAAVWQAAWLLSGPAAGRTSWLRPWESWQMWMPKGGDPRYRLNTLYRELVMWVFASTGDDRGFRKTGGGWDAKRFQKLSQLQLPKDKVYATLAELSRWRTHDDYDPFVCVIRISKIWETK